MNNNDLLEAVEKFVETGNSCLRIFALWNIILLAGYGFAAWLIFQLMVELKTLL